MSPQNRINKSHDYDTPEYRWQVPEVQVVCFGLTVCSSLIRKILVFCDVHVRTSKNSDRDIRVSRNTAHVLEEDSREHEPFGKRLTESLFVAETQIETDMNMKLGCLNAQARATQRSS